MLLPIEPGYICVAEASLFRRWKSIITKIIFLILSIIVSICIQNAAVTALVMVVELPLFIIDKAIVKSCKYYFYSDHIIVIEGVINKNRRMAFLNKIITVNYHQCLWGRIFNYGDVYIRQLFGDSFNCYCIKHPGLIAGKMEDFITASGNRIF